MRKFSRCPIVLLIVTAALALTSCEWNNEVYEAYKGNKGFFKCSGYCDLSRLGLAEGQTIDKDACQAAVATWVALDLTDDEGNKLDDAGYCAITTKDECTRLVKHYTGSDAAINDIWTPQQAMDLGNGRYIVTLDDEFFCGSYHALFSQDTPFDTEKLRNACTPSDIESFTHALNGGFCPKDKQECVRYEVQATSPINVALCSSCIAGQAVCMDPMTAQFVCTDILSNEQNCGGCMKVCQSGQQCLQGHCVDTTQTVCTNDDGTTTIIYPYAKETCGATCEQRNGMSCGNNAACVANVDQDNIYYQCECYNKNMLSCTTQTSENKNENYCISPSLLDDCGITCEDDPDNYNNGCFFGQECKDKGNGYTCQCPENMIECNGTCIDPKTNNIYCGASGNCTAEGEGNTTGVTCRDGKTCVNGECTCPKDFVTCEGKCINPADPSTCGATNGESRCTGMDCGNAECTPKSSTSTSTSESTKYVCGCQGVECGDTCIDPLTNHDHCGSKEQTCEQLTKCSENQMCSNGECKNNCAEGTQVCNINGVPLCIPKDRKLNSDCTDCDNGYCPATKQTSILTLNCEAPLNTNENCGGCYYAVNESNTANLGNRCIDSNISCINEACVCNEPDSICEMSTQNTLNMGDSHTRMYGCLEVDYAHANVDFKDGICYPKNDFDNCDNKWKNGYETDLRTTAEHCGSCNHRCMDAPFNGTPTCKDKKCDFQCNSGYTACNASCVNLNDDKDNCGACGHACRLDEICMSGLCCGIGQMNCNNQCVDILSDNNNCGGCGVVCTGKCMLGTCRGNSNTTCRYPMEDCKNWIDGCETNLTSDIEHCGACNNNCSSQWPNNNACIKGTCCNQSGEEVWNDNSKNLVCCSGYKLCVKEQYTNKIYKCQRICAVDWHEVLSR